MHLETLLIVVIIIMLFIQYDKMHHKQAAPAPAPVTATPASDATKSSFVYGREQFDQYANERTANQDNIDYYQTCTGADSSRAPCVDPCSGDLDYAVHEFGGEGLDYKGWVTAQSVDPAVIQNHSEFIRDRLENSKTSNITGRTYTPDAGVEYNEIPWTGLRRPQAVKVCNPSQLAEANQNCYSHKSRISWDSS